MNNKKRGVLLLLSTLATSSLYATETMNKKSNIIWNDHKKITDLEEFNITENKYIRHFKNEKESEILELFEQVLSNNRTNNTIQNYRENYLDMGFLIRNQANHKKIVI